MSAHPHRLTTEKHGKPARDAPLPSRPDHALPIRSAAMTLSKRILSRRRAFLAAGAGAAVFALAACGGGGDPLADSSASPAAGGGGTVIVGSANFTESQVLGELYAQAMKAKGVDVQIKP